MASPEGSTLMDNLSVITSPTEAEAQKVAAFLRNAKESSKTLRAVLG
jgi:cytochrome c1